MPESLNVARDLGYPIELQQSNIVKLPEASTGDLNFLRMLTRAKVQTNRIVSNHNLLSIRPGNRLYECTSSWLTWARNTPACIGCNYCIIQQIEYLKRQPVEIGSHPSKMLTDLGPRTDFAAFSQTKMRPEVSELRSYESVRVTKPCRKIHYAQKALTA